MGAVRTVGALEGGRAEAGGNHKLLLVQLPHMHQVGAQTIRSCPTCLALECTI